MAEEAIPYASGLASGLEPLNSPGATQTFTNWVVDGAGAMRTRPGVSAFQTTPGVAEIDGLVVPNGTALQDVAIYSTREADGSRRLWAVLVPNGPLALSDATPGTQLQGALRPVMCVTTIGVIVTAGGPPQALFTPGLSYVLPGGPPNCSHMVEINGRLVTNSVDDSGLFFWSGTEFGVSGVGTYETWVTTQNFRGADARPDPIVAVHENTRELWLFGISTVQLYGVSTDALSPFAEVNTLNVGTAAPYSVVAVDNNFAWIDNQRRIVMSDGRSINVLSTPFITKQLGAISSLSDCWAFRSRIGAYDFLVFVLPTDKTAFAYEHTTKKWGEWRGFSAGEWDKLMFSAYAYYQNKNLHLVGTNNGLGICQLDLDSPTDMGTTILSEVITGFVDHGTDVRKRNLRATYSVRRGTGSFGSSGSSFEVCHRDDLGAWNPWRQLSVGVAGDYETTLLDFAGGVYRSRQHRMRYSGSDPLVLAGAKEFFEAGRS